jgi:multidrug efflux system outer membrane protein
MKKQLLAPVLLAALLSGCSLIPNYERPQTETPSGWTESNASQPTVIARDWWRSFNSEELNALMNQALAQNNDINAAIQRVNQARGIARAAGSTLLPSVDGTASAGYERNDPAEGRKTSDKVGSVGLLVSYELDLFGANRAEVEAADADVDAAGFDKDVIALIVMADTAKAYFNVLNLQERLSIADQNVASAKDLLRIVQARYDAGATTLLDVAQQKTDLANTEAARALIEQQLKTARSALAVLVGKPPQSLQVTGKDLRTLAVPEIAPGQPSVLLERRPDIRAAEAGLIAANADIGAARAAFFPTVTLGLDATASAAFGDPATKLLTAAASLAAPIFKGGLLEGNLEYTKARKAELVENYRKSVLVSFKDVEDALAAVKAAQQREASLETALTESRRAYDLSKQQYDVGTIDFQTLLDTRQTMLVAEDNYIQTKNDRLAAATDLYKALGGGWIAGDTIAQPSQPTPQDIRTQQQ